MSQKTKRQLLQKILSGQSDANVRFGELRSLLQELGFDERIRGSHYIYRKQGLMEKPNLQRDGGHAKPYQVRQIRRLILKYHLGGND